MSRPVAAPCWDRGVPARTEFCADPDGFQTTWLRSCASRHHFADDLRVRRDTLHAAILRSPHAHAEILSVDVEGALALSGIDCVVIGEDARRWTRPFAVAVKTPMQHWRLAVDRVRYVGEPVAVALARDRHIAEDALERIAVRYRPRVCTGANRL
jgi:CO/xanthine dehydrogenase Mo-binding subunit